MTRPLTTRARGLAAAAALTLLAACSAEAPSGRDASASPSGSTSTSAGPTPTTAAEPPRPPSPACYDLDYDQAVKPTTDADPVRCGARHASTTFFVGEADSVVNGHLAAVDSDRVQRQIARACPRRLPGFLGTTPRELRLSMLRAIWFSPSIEASDAGANWFRCDVIALADDRQLAPLQGPMRGVLRTPAARERYGVCGTTKPGTPRFRRVICARPHTWRAIDSFDGPAGRYPGPARLRSIGEDVCRAAARSRAENSLDYQWAMDWPTREQWREGQRWGLCWAPDA